MGLVVTLLTYIVVMHQDIYSINLHVHFLLFFIVGLKLIINLVSKYHGLIEGSHPLLEKRFEKDMTGNDEIIFFIRSE